MSEKHRRLIAGDVCTNVSRVIPDTDGRGHSTLPPQGWFAWLGEHLLKGLAWLAVRLGFLRVFVRVLGTIGC